MDIYTAAEQAYKNGYEKAVKKFTERVKEQDGNIFLESWCESYIFNQEKFNEFIDGLTNELLEDIK